MHESTQYQVLVVPKIIRGFLQNWSNETLVQNMTNSTYCFYPKFMWQRVLIDHSSTHVLKSSIFSFNHTIYLRRSWRREVISVTLIITKGIKLLILKFSFMITSNGKYIVTFVSLNFFLKNFKILQGIIFVRKKHNRCKSCVIINNDQNIPFIINASSSSMTK